MPKKNVLKFSDEQILKLAKNKLGFLVNRHNSKDSVNNSRAYKLHKKGYLTFGQYDSAHRQYCLTDDGKEYLEELQKQSESLMGSSDGLTNLAPHIRIPKLRPFK